MGQIEIRNVYKSFGELEVIRGVDLTITDGELIIFVGPSGCGKSTLLRLISGLEEVSEGLILIDGEDVTGKPPAERHLSMVFQSYALYPHKTVRENMGFGLTVARTPKPEITRMVDEDAAADQALARRVEELVASFAADGFFDPHGGNDPQRIALMADYMTDPGERGRLFTFLKNLVVERYYSTEIGLAQELGMDKIVNFSRKMGVYDDLLPVLSMALGAGETTLMKMVTAYGIIDNGGKRVTPTLIDRIQDRFGRTVYRHDKRECAAKTKTW